MIVQKKILISGKVQGVGFRMHTARQAQQIGGLKGYVRNLTNGCVEVLVQGEKSKADALVQYCKKGPAHAEVTTLHVHDEKINQDLDLFQIQY